MSNFLQLTECIGFILLQQHDLPSRICARKLFLESNMKFISSTTSYKIKFDEQIKSKKGKN